MRMRRLFAGIVMITLTLILVPRGALKAEEMNFKDNTILDSELLLLEVRLEGMKLRDEFLAGYHHDGRVLIPLGQLAGFLELPLDVRPERGIVEGFIWEAEKRYRIDVSAGSIRVNGQTISQNGQRVVVSRDDIYIDTELLSEWLPLDVEVNPYSAVLEIKAARPLPLQERMKRRHRWERLPAGRDRGDEPLYPAVENPYTIFSGPFIDQDFSLACNGSGNYSLGHRTSLTGDILYLSGQLFLSGTLEAPLSDINFRLGRRSPEPDLLGPFKAHEFWLGDVNQPGISNISPREAIKGVYISSFPYVRPDKFYSHNFEGKLPQGWEVELYDRGRLVDYQRSNDEGKYLFKDVPIKYGMNEFTLVFYDEYGQEHRESKVFRIDSALIPPGEDRYLLSAGLDGDDRPRYLLKFNRGLSDRLSLRTDYVRIQEDNDLRDFARMGLLGSLDGILWQGAYLQEMGGGRGVEVGLNTNLAGTDISLQHARFDNYNSIEVGGLKSRTSLELSRSFKLPLIPTLGSRLKLDRKKTIDGEVSTEIHNNLSMSYRDISFRNDVDFRLGEEKINGSGEFRVYSRLGNYRLRGEIDYLINPFAAGTAAVDLYSRLDKGRSLNLRISRDLNGGTNTYSAGVSWAREDYQLGLETSYNDGDGCWGLGLSLSTSYGRDARDNKLKPVASAHCGAVSLRTYLDAGAEKVPIKGVGYKINGKTYEARTDENGCAFISGLRADIKTDIAIDPETLADPFLIAEPEGVNFIPRPGQSFQLELPVVMTGELGGFVYLKSESGTTGASGIEVQLTDLSGEIIRSTTTAFDGYFYLSEIRPGQYRLQVGEKSTGRRGLTGPEAVEITIPPTGGYIEGFEYILEVILEGEGNSYPPNAEIALVKKGGNQI